MKNMSEWVIQDRHLYYFKSSQYREQKTIWTTFTNVWITQIRGKTTTHFQNQNQDMNSGIFLTWKHFPVLQQMAWILLCSINISCLYNQSKITQMFLWWATSFKKVGIFGFYTFFISALLWLANKETWCNTFMFYFQHCFFCWSIFMHNFKQTT